MDALSLVDFKNMPDIKAEVGLLCASEFHSIWYRARVIATEPEIKVDFIDYGNQEVCTKDQIKALPYDVSKYPDQVSF